MKLSDNFQISEFTRNDKGLANDAPSEVIPILKEFCDRVLEPIRTRFGKVRISSGFRGADLNKLIGGTADSYHCATSTRCAADIQAPGTQLQEVFDWIRMESDIPFDKVILERGKTQSSETDDCIHIQYQKEPRRLAYSGATQGQSAYTKVDVA